jgi:glycosyltransferase involved in cell wall biosynthesis
LSVVQILPSLEGGGVERGTIELSQELVRLGHRSIVVSGGGRLVAEIEAHGGRHVTWSVGKKSPFTLQWVWPLRRLLQQERVDILHARSRVPAWAAWLAWKSLPKQTRPHFVTTAHGLYSVNRYSEVMTFGERVIAISHTVEAYLNRSYPRLDPARIRVIPRGIDPEQFPRGFTPSAAWQDQWQETYPQLIGKPVISLVGRITRLKGHDDFVEIIDQLRRQIPEIQGLIVGGEDPKRKAYAEEIRSLIRKRGLQQHITFTGQRSDVREIYAASNVVLSLTSDPPEAFGRTTVEALNIGTPVVGYDHGGTGEILRTMFPRGAVSPGDAYAAAAAICDLLARGSSIPREHPYLKRRMLEQTLAVYDEVISGAEAVSAPAPKRRTA